MLQIDIHIPRPFLTLGMLGAVAGYMVTSWLAPAAAVGGTGATQAQVVREAEEEVKRLRMEQEVLARREDILRMELEALADELRVNRDPVVEEQMQETRRRLIALIQNRHEGEREILESLRQIWEAQGYAMHASRGNGAGTISLIWPIEPELGISARFEDDGYEARFGIPHHAIDIPAMQGSVVAAAADGTVVSVTDNGYGFNSLVIKHAGGFATMYGHVTEFLVSEGDRVRAGDPVALSGGRPGTKGAGTLTTGAHLHFELLRNGEQVDPLTYLPSR